MLAKIKVKDLKIINHYIKYNDDIMIRCISKFQL